MKPEWPDLEFPPVNLYVVTDVLWFYDKEEYALFNSGHGMYVSQAPPNKVERLPFRQKELPHLRWIKNR